MRHRIRRFDPWVGKIPWSRKWQPTPVFLAWEIPWTEESGRLQSNGSQRVGQNWAIKQQDLKIAFKSFYFYFVLHLLLILITCHLQLAGLAVFMVTKEQPQHQVSYADPTMSTGRRESIPSILSIPHLPECQTPFMAREMGHQIGLNQCWAEWGAQTSEKLL